MGKILIVDDELIVRRALVRLLAREGHQCEEASNGEEALEKLAREPADLVILDIRMPGKSGFEILPLVRARCPDTAVVMATAVADAESAIQCLKQGAYDYFIKPLNFEEVAIGVERALEKRRLELENRAYQHHLEELVAERTEDLRKALIRLKQASLDTIHRLARAAEYKDRDIGPHIKRIGQYCAIIANRLRLSREEIENIGYAAPLHDIGKIGIPDRILMKSGKLDPHEQEIMKSHTIIGAELLKGSDVEFIQMAETIALTHHERWDGSGYPAGLKGGKIPLYGRIVAVADAFDAMASERHYKPALPLEQVFHQMEEGKGTQFDPDIVDAFISAREKVIEIWERSSPQQEP
ncbi:MAG: response regulator [Dehalococcoidales bacterium]|nr:response regulator [Dehalococcoidales bacterium]